MRRLLIENSALRPTAIVLAENPEGARIRRNSVCGLEDN